jgi:hypothetical protein
MHGNMGGPVYKGSGPSGTNSVPRSNTANNTGGMAGKVIEQKPIPGPETTGGPISMKKALAKKRMPSGTGVGGPNKGTSAPGSR